jgi:hypothetical protein
MQANLPSLQSTPVVLIRQKRELAELFGFETRNKYSIEQEDGQIIAFAAEQQKGILGLFLRQILGHWRRFHFTIFGSDRTPVLTARHPFRFFFQRMELFTGHTSESGTQLGAIQQRFGILNRKMDLLDARGEALFHLRSPLWRIWTFTVYQAGRTDPQECAVIRKKWGGLLKEAFLDADSFRIEYKDPGLTQEHRLLLIAAGLFLDLQYFEKKAN